MMWFCQRDNRTGVIKRRDLGREPSMTVCASGKMDDALASDYWIESGSGAMI